MGPQGEPCTASSLHLLMLAALACSLFVPMLLIGACLGYLAMLALVHIVAARGHASPGSPAVHPASCRPPELGACLSSSTAACITAGLALRAVLQPQMAQCGPGWVCFIV